MLRATWDVNGLRDGVSRYTVDFMPSEEVVLSVDETGFLKKETNLRVLVDNIQARQAELKIVRLVFFYLVPQHKDVH